MNYTIEHQWQEYLKRAELPEHMLGAVQRQEMRRAFFGAWGQALISFRDEVAALDEVDAIAIMEKQLKEVTDFWLKEQERQN